MSGNFEPSDADLERLRSYKAENRKRERDSGIEAGKRWAVSPNTEPRELELLTERYTGEEEELDAEEVALVLNNYPSIVFGRESDKIKGEFVAGFVSAAIDVFRMV